MSRNCVFGFYFECVANPYMSWRGLDWTRPRLGHLSCQACHVCLCNPYLLLLLLQLGLLLAYANARHCYCDSFLLQLAKYVCQMWFAYNVGETERAERGGRGYGFGMPFSRTALRYFCPALVAGRRLCTLCATLRYVRVCIGNPRPSPTPSCLVICQLCDRQTKHSADCACFIVMTPASVRPSRTCDSIYMRISRTCDLSSGH